MLVATSFDCDLYLCSGWERKKQQTSPIGEHTNLLLNLSQVHFKGNNNKYVSCDDSLESNILFSKLFQNLQIRSCTEAIAETVGSIMNQHLGSNRYCFLDLRCDLVITNLLKNTTLWLWIYWVIQASHSSPLQQGVGVGIQSRPTGDTYCTCEVVMFIWS